MCNGTSQEYDEAGDLAYLDIRIIQMERRLLETVADAVAPMGWKAHFAELFLEDGTLTANVRVSLNRSHPDAFPLQGPHRADRQPGPGRGRLGHPASTGHTSRITTLPEDVLCPHHAITRDRSIRTRAPTCPW